MVRPASEADAEAVTAIYNHYVLESTVTFDTEPKTIEDRVRWLTDRRPEHPVLVAITADSGAEVVGFASLSPYRERPAWARTVEVGVYVHPEHLSVGVGAALMRSALDAARDAGHHVVVGQIVSDNAASIAAATRAGFTRIGTLHEVGRKFDRWLDVDIFELRL